MNYQWCTSIETRKAMISEPHLAAERKKLADAWRRMRKHSQPVARLIYRRSKMAEREVIDSMAGFLYGK